MTILLFNNRIYGLTKGQYSPTSEPGKVTKSTPMGSVDHPFNPVSLALGAEASFVARTIDSDRKHLTAVLSAAAAHRGTSLVEIYQNCPIFNDGAFDAIKNPDTKADAIIPLVHGEQIRFGALDEDGRGTKALVRDRASGGVKIVEVARGRRRRHPRPRRPQRRPVDGVRDLPADRLRLPQPVADRHLPPGRAADVRRPGPRPDHHRPGRGRPATRPHRLAGADRRRRHLDRRLTWPHTHLARPAGGSRVVSLELSRRRASRSRPWWSRSRGGLHLDAPLPAAGAGAVDLRLVLAGLVGLDLADGLPLAALAGPSSAAAPLVGYGR